MIYHYSFFFLHAGILINFVDSSLVGLLHSLVVTGGSVTPSGYTVVAILGLEINLVHEVEGCDWDLISEWSKSQWE